MYMYIYTVYISYIYIIYNTYVYVYIYFSYILYFDDKFDQFVNYLYIFTFTRICNNINYYNNC